MLTIEPGQRACSLVKLDSPSWRDEVKGLGCGMQFQALQAKQASRLPLHDLPGDIGRLQSTLDLEPGQAEERRSQAS